MLKIHPEGREFQWSIGIKGSHQIIGMGIHCLLAVDNLCPSSIAFHSHTVSPICYQQRKKKSPILTCPSYPSPSPLSSSPAYAHCWLVIACVSGFLLGFMVLGSMSFVSAASFKSNSCATGALLSVFHSMRRNLQVVW